MYTLIEYPTGVVLEGVVLSMEPNRLRVAVPGASDVLELSQSGTEWITDGNESIKLGFLQYAAQEAPAVVPEELQLVARAAGSSYFG